MLSWLLRQLNVTGDLIDHLDQVVFAFHSSWVLWVGVAFACPCRLVHLHLAASQSARHAAGLCAVLTMTRVLILALLLFILAGPHLKLEYTVQQKPIVAVLLDHSRSMELPAGPFETDETCRRSPRRPATTPPAPRTPRRARRSTASAGPNSARPSCKPAAGR